MTSAGLVSGRATVLITGMSGTGKSTVLKELAMLGHRVVDTDIGGWIVEEQNSNGAEPVWDLDRIRALLGTHLAGWLFVAGCVANQRLMYDRFDRIVLLSAPLDVVLARVQSRANPFGSTAEDRARIAADLTAFEPLLRAGADHEIVTTAPLATVVAAVEQVAAAVP
jgi:dephospho-CoA kinase